LGLISAPWLTSVDGMGMPRLTIEIEGLKNLVEIWWKLNE
jgi:hypothetical protein